MCYLGVNWSTAILACMVDFSMQNHNVLITTLNDMALPACLLKIVMAFLTDRNMVVRYKGAKSSEKYLPWGGPHGTLLGFLLFLVLINDAGFDNQINNAGEIISIWSMKQACYFSCAFTITQTVYWPLKKSSRLLLSISGKL